MNKSISTIRRVDSKVALLESNVNQVDLETKEESETLFVDFTTGLDDNEENEIKCHEFWNYISTRPDLEAIKVRGCPIHVDDANHGDSGTDSEEDAAGMEDIFMHNDQREYPYTDGLIRMQATGMDEIAIATSGDCSECDNPYEDPFTPSDHDLAQINHVMDNWDHRLEFRSKSVLDSGNRCEPRRSSRFAR